MIEVDQTHTDDSSSQNSEPNSPHSLEGSVDVNRDSGGSKNLPHGAFTKSDSKPVFDRILSTDRQTALSKISHDLHPNI